MENGHTSLDCVEYFLKNITLHRKEIDRDEMKKNMEELEKNVEKGLSYTDLNALAHHVVFTDAYDLMTRRKILYCMVPVDSEFPYGIIPLAISHCSLVPSNPTWQSSVLNWLCSLLEHGVIDAYNKFVHICYTSIFNFTSSLSLTLLSCKILGYMTRLEDVTAWRANILMHLKEKPGFFDKVSQLLRVYQLFRPDLVYGKLSYKNFTRTSPRVLKRGMLALRARLEDSELLQGTASSDGDIWGGINKVERPNPHQRQTAVPRPDNTYYPGTMEEKTDDKVFVSQYRRFEDLANGIHQWKSWKWPNNPSTHLASPIIIPLFRPDDLTVLITLTNWLQVALRTELIEGLGNPSKERCERLLKAVLSLVKETGSQIPIVNNFLFDFIGVWDQKSNFSLILSLMEHVSYTSAEFFSLTYLKLVVELLDNASMVKWCKVVESIKNMACVWAVRAWEEHSGTQEYMEWPSTSDSFSDSSVVGLWYLMTTMERFFYAALIEYNYHPLIMHQIIDFFVKVNMHAEVLNLPVVFLPPAPFTLAVITHSDLACVHRLGKLMASTPASVERVKRMKTYGSENDTQVECLSMCESFNVSIQFFLRGVFIGTAFDRYFEKELDPFYSFNFLTKMLSSPSARKFAHVTHALPYLPLYAERLIEVGDRELTKDEVEDLRTEVVTKLEADGFTGIGKCVRAYF
ncbi:centromere protein I-like [Palaemon carinicauda]|uniref:centromere protein I-like n=1 Tax=Palaemon carinicauda TaxID=392227 RepID=UPI0035B63E2F